MRSTPIAAMEEVTGIQPLQKRRDLKIVLKAKKFKCQQSHPMNKRFQKLNQKAFREKALLVKLRNLKQPTTICQITQHSLICIVLNHGKKPVVQE